MELPVGRGSEQRGGRPVLVIQNDTGNRYAETTIVAVITGTIKTYPFTVILDQGEGGLRRASMVNLAHILTLDKGRLERRLGRLTDQRMGAVDDALRVSLAL